VCCIRDGYNEVNGKEVFKNKRNERRELRVTIVFEKKKSALIRAYARAGIDDDDRSLARNIEANVTDDNSRTTTVRQRNIERRSTCGGG